MTKRNKSYKVRSVNMHQQRDADLIRWTDKIPNFGGFVRDLLYRAKQAEEEEDTDPGVVHLAPEDINQIRRIISLELERKLRDLTINIADPGDDPSSPAAEDLTELQDNLLQF